MNNYKLITPLAELDTYGDIDISINYAIDDIYDISKRNTSWTKTIKLPGTPQNNKFFNHLYDVNIDNITFNLVKRVPAKIRIGTNDILNGYMQLINIVIINKKVEYEITIAGSLRSIISTISDYNLNAIDLSEYNHQRTAQNIVYSWDYNIYKFSALTSVNLPGDGYVYPYIVNGNSQDIFNNVYVSDLFPAIYVKTIWKKIMELAGFTYTSKFIESEYFSKLIIPFTGDKLQLSEEEIESRSVRVGALPPFTYMSPYQKNGGDWYYTYMENYKIPLKRESGTVTDINGELKFTDIENQWDGNVFTCAHPGYYDISFVGKLIAEYKRWNGPIKWFNDSLEYRYFMEVFRTNGTVTKLYDSGGLNFTPSDGAQHTSPWKDTANPLVCNMIAQNVYLGKGDKIVMTFGHRHPSSVDWQGFNKDTETRIYFEDVNGGEFTKFIVKPTNEQFDSTIVNMNQILDSKIKMKDFFLDIVKMFNLIIADNPNKENDIIVEPRDQFFESRQRVLNWDETKKLDLDSDIIITPMSELDFQNYRFTYSEDSDFFNEQYTNETNRIYGDYEYKIDNDFSDKTNELKLNFAPTPNAQKYIDNKVAPFFLTIEADKLKSKKVKPRILFYGGTIPLNAGSKFTIKNFKSDKNFITETRYPYCGMWDNPNPQWDLSFGRTSKIYWDSKNIFPNQNLFERFHKQTLQNIVDKNAKLLECTVYLTPKDIADFDFRDIVFLLGSYWRVNKIKDYNPVQTDRLTRVVLYKIINLNIISKLQVQIPTSNKSCPVDMVTKKTKQGYVITSTSGKEITEDCCKQVGGSFTNGMCYLPNPNVEPPKSLKQPPNNSNSVNELSIGNLSVSALGNGYGLSVIPIIDSNGPLVLSNNLNTVNSANIQTLGSENYIAGGVESGMIIGSNSTILSGVTNAVVIGDGISANENGALFIGGIKINQDGNILKNGINIIDGGLNEVFNFNKTNPIEIIDGTIDSVRNAGGSSYARPIIDGGQ